MGNHKMGHRQTRINSTSPRVLDVAIVEIWRQPTKIEAIQLLNAIIPTIRVEIVVVANTNFVRGGILTKSTTNLGCGSRRVSTRRNLSRDFGLPPTTTKVVGTPQMVFTNLIITICVNMIPYWPPMSSIATRGYKSIDVENLRGGYWKSFIIIAKILDHRNGHFVRPNKVVFKYLDFKKDVNPDVHVRLFNFVVKLVQKLFKSISSMCSVIC